MSRSPAASDTLRPTLVVGTAPRVALTVARSLHRRGIRVVAVPSSEDEGRIPTRAIREYVELPDARLSPEEFDEGLERAVKRTGADMLALCSDKALAAVARNYANLRALCDPGCPPPEISARVLDKSITIACARELGISVPLTFDGRAADFDLSRLPFPVIAKPRSHAGLGGPRITYFLDAATLAAAMGNDPGFAARYLLQQYVPGSGVGVALLMRGGQPVAVFAHRRLKELPAAGGVSAVSESIEPDPRLLERSVALLRALEWEGVALVEFRRATDGTDWLMEVNGRYWGTLANAVAAGVDFPYYQWQIAHGVLPVPPAAYREGVRVRWTRGAILRLRERLFEPPGFGTTRPNRRDEVRAFRTDFSPQVRSAMWDARDPLPAIIDVFPGVRRFAGSALRAIAKAAVPRGVMRAYRAYGTQGVWEYLRMPRERLRRPFTPRAVLFVCSGNIMRSALAAVVFRAALHDAGVDDVDVESSGLYAADGTPADPRAVAVADTSGLDLLAHRARMMDEELAQRADAIFAMDRLQELELLRRFPASRNKVYALGACLAKLPRVEIPDPYLRDDAESARILALVASRAGQLARVVAADVTNRPPTGGEGATKGATSPGAG